jgi:hypothetical protein
MTTPLARLRRHLLLMLVWGFPLVLLATWMFTGATRTVVLRWWFLGGFAFLVSVGAWFVVAITRMRQEQAMAITKIETLAARFELREAIERLTHVDASPPKADDA